MGDVAPGGLCFHTNWSPYRGLLVGWGQDSIHPSQGEAVKKEAGEVGKKSV